MRSFKILPVVSLSRVATLSRDALRRLEWMDWYFGHGRNAEVACRHFSISKSVFYRWLNRFDRYNLTTLEFDTKKRRPKTLRTMTTPQSVINRIHDIRLADLEKSKYEIHEELQREGIKVAHNVIQKVINRNSELHNVQSAKQVSRRNGRKFYLFAAVDCKSRYAYIWAYTTASSASAADFLARVKQAFPFQIKALNTDNGSEYLLHFHQASQRFGLAHYFSYPHTPQMNGRVERFIQTATYEFFNWQADLIPEVSFINQKCTLFNHKYTQSRFHRALGYQTPAEYVKSYLLEKGATVLYV